MDNLAPTTPKPQWRINIERLMFEHYLKLALASGACPACHGMGCSQCGYSGERIVSCE